MVIGRARKQFLRLSTNVIISDLMQHDSQSRLNVALYGAVLASTHSAGSLTPVAINVLAVGQRGHICHKSAPTFSYTTFCLFYTTYRRRRIKT